MSSVLSIEYFDMLVFESHPNDSIFLPYIDATPWPACLPRIALLTFAFNEIQEWRRQLKKSRIMPGVDDSFRGSSLKQSS
jgi:hypothetical protein